MPEIFCHFFPEIFNSKYGHQEVAVTFDRRIRLRRESMFQEAGSRRFILRFLPFFVVSAAVVVPGVGKVTAPQGGP